MLAVGAILTSVETGAAQRDPLQWPEVTRESRPWTRWWWLGSAVDSANLTREIGQLAEAGFGGVEVTSIYGVRGRESAFVPYLSDRWIRLVGHAAAEAGRRGMGLDLPPGSGWRMGGPDVPVEDASVSLRIRADTVRGGEVWRAGEGGRPDALVAYSDAGRTVDLLEMGSADQWRAPEGRWIVYRVEVRGNGEQVKRPAPGGAGNAVDVLSRDAVDRYLSGFARQTGRLPRGTVRSFFHDSYEYTGNTSRELFGYFAARRGYDLRQYLPALAGAGDPEVVARVKADYRETMAEMLHEHLLTRFTAWTHGLGSLSRNQAHGSPGNILDLYAASDIPETEIFGPLGGTDSDPLISKFASSAANVSGKRLVAAEAMTWLAEHFTESLDQVKRAADQLFVSGVNHLVYHGTAYSPADADWPGWLFYASTQFNPRNALWRDLPALNRYVTRVQSVLQSGRADNDVLLYWPIHDSWHDAAGLRMDFRVHDPKWFHGQAIGSLARTLWQRGFAFDYVSDRLLTDAVKAADGAATAGGIRYRAILIPRTGHIPDATMARLLQLAEGGATVLFHERLPEDVPGLAGLETRRARLAALRERLAFEQATPGGVRIARMGTGRVMIGDGLEALLRAAGVAREPVVDREGVRFVRRSFDGGWHYFLTHGGERAIDDWVPLSVPAAAAALMDPLTGRVGFAMVRQRQGGGSEVYLQLEPGQSMLIRAFAAPTDGPGWSYVRPVGAPVGLRGRWSVEFIAGGPTLPASYRADSLASWTGRGPAAERFAGTARYTLRFDAPAAADDFLLDLGQVAESARVRLNGRDLGTLFARPFRVRTGELQSSGNRLEVEVTNLSANRIRDLDRRGVAWKIFHDINFVGIDYRPFDASGWPVRPSGLLGPVRLQPLSRIRAEPAGKP